MSWDNVSTVEPFDHAAPLGRLIRGVAAHTVTKDVPHFSCDAAYVMLEAFEGACLLECHGECHRLSAGNTFLIPPGTPFGLTDFSPGSKVVIVIFGGIALHCGKPRSLAWKGKPLLLTDDTPVRRFAKRVFDIGAERGYLYTQELRHLHLEVLNQCLPAVEKISFLSFGKRVRLVCRTMLLIERNIMDIPPLPDLATELGTSYSTMRSVFRQYSGMCIKKYQLLSKMDLATQKLATQVEVAVAETACELAYEDPQYFSRIVKKHTGLSPTEWKKVTPSFNSISKAVRDALMHES